MNISERDSNPNKFSNSFYSLLLPIIDRKDNNKAVFKLCNGTLALLTAYTKTITFIPVVNLYDDWYHRAFFFKAEFIQTQNEA